MFRKFGGLGCLQGVGGFGLVLNIGVPPHLELLYPPVYSKTPEHLNI